MISKFARLGLNGLKKLCLVGLFVGLHSDCMVHFELTSGSSCPWTGGIETKAPVRACSVPVSGCHERGLEKRGFRLQAS